MPDGMNEWVSPLPPKRERLIDLMRQESLSHCQTWGGYPDAIDDYTVPGYVIVASLDEAKERQAPDLTVYTWDEIDDWGRRLDEFIAESSFAYGDDEDAWSDAVMTVEAPKAESYTRGADCLPTKVLELIQWKRKES